jgi:hypothetical protein
MKELFGKIYSLQTSLAESCFGLHTYITCAGAQAFLMDYPQGERAITHHAGPVRIYMNEHDFI